MLQSTSLSPEGVPFSYTDKTSLWLIARLGGLFLLDSQWIPRIGNELGKQRLPGASVVFRRFPVAFRCFPCKIRQTSGQLRNKNSNIRKQNCQVRKQTAKPTNKIQNPQTNSQIRKKTTTTVNNPFIFLIPSPKELAV